MPDAALRFLHASDFHLDLPLGGVADVPESLRDKFIDAPYLAARRVFDTALAEEVDFVLLAGGLLHSRRSGPRGVAFLVEQFERLGEHGVPIYWVGGPHDHADAWPAAVRLPSNVIHFRNTAAVRHVVLTNGQPRALIVGRSHAGRRRVDAADYIVDHSAPFRIALAHGMAEPHSLRARGFDYWALGGRLRRGTTGTGTERLHYPGTPQGRLPEETGPRGCTVVRVDAEGRSHLDFVATDVVRWRTERVSIEPLGSRAELEHHLRERVALAASEAGPIDLLISWTLVGTAAAWSRFRNSVRPAELVEWLRREFTGGAYWRWSAGVEVETIDATQGHSLDQDTILGEFLREVRRHAVDETLPLDLNPYIGARHAASPVAAWASTIDAGQRGRLLNEVAALGVELLATEEVEP